MACFIGIDVAKATLDVATGQTSSLLPIANDEAGDLVLSASLTARRPTLVVLEVTGGYELSITVAPAAGLPVVVVDPATSGTSRRPPGSWP